MEAHLAQLRQRWQQLLWSFHIEQGRAQAVFCDLVAAYCSAGRIYHTLDHIQAVLDWTDRLAVYARHLPVIGLAAWLHDSVYDTHEEDNEERSAAYAEELLNRVGIPQEITRAVRQMILSTKTHWADAEESDCHILLDADLAILGAPMEAYARYAQAIRQEYSWVRQEDYRAERKRLLEGLLQREHIYWTPLMRETLEQRARDNMQRELSSLS
jgi:predicted metal-dependent HD superfamily phosphohydrolase